MAVDTLVKRRSAISVGFYWRDLLLFPDGTTATAPAERYTLGGVYAGLASQWGPVPSGPGGGWAVVDPEVLTVYLTDDDGAFLTDDDGAYLIAVVSTDDPDWTDVPAGPSGGWVTV